MAASKTPSPGVCLPMQGNAIGSQYDFQLGKGHHNRTLYIANRYFLPKSRGKPNYVEPLLAKDALQDNLFQSIVRFQQQAQSKKIAIAM